MIIKIKEDTPIMEALLFDDSNIEEVKKFIPKEYEFENGWLIKKDSFRVKLTKGWYLVKDVDGTLFERSKEEIMLNYEVLENG